MLGITEAMTADQERRKAFVAGIVARQKAEAESKPEPKPLPKKRSPRPKRIHKSSAERRRIAELKAMIASPEWQELKKVLNG